MLGAIALGLAAPFCVRTLAGASRLAQPNAGATLQIRPRSAWADADPVGPLYPETHVRFLLVHHTAGSNSYTAGGVPGILRGIYRLHTGPERGWPDVAYNFFVDRFGVAREGRAGSLARARPARAMRCTARSPTGASPRR